MSSRRLSLAVLGLVLASLGIALAASPPAFVRSLFSVETPSTEAGGRPPMLADRPLVRLAVAGDPGTGDAEQMATAAAIDEQDELLPYDGLLLLGDLVYEDGEAELVDDRVLEPFEPVLDDGAALVPVLGNHDYYSGEQQQILARLGRDRSWYVERIGPLRLVVLDSERVGSTAQDRWLRRTLAETQPAGTWTVVAVHRPPYSAGYHGSDLQVRRAWSDLFAEADVPLVLSGHEHDYQRTTPQHGVTYVVSGAAAKLRRTGTADFTAVSSTTRHFLDLVVYEDRLLGRAIDQQGRLVDRFELTR